MIVSDFADPVTNIHIWVYLYHQCTWMYKYPQLLNYRKTSESDSSVNVQTPVNSRQLTVVLAVHPQTPYYTVNINFCC